MNQQIDSINLLDCQIACSQSAALTRLLDVTTERFPTTDIVEPDTCIGFPTQNIEPMPPIQLAQDCHRAKFATSDEKNSCSNRDQFTHIGQQSQLLACAAMPFDVFDPGPSNWNGPFSLCQADNQQLMPKANLGPVYNQTHISEMTELCFKSLASDRFVPFPHPDGRIIQQSAQTPCVTQQLRRTGDFPCHSAQGNGSALGYSVS